MSISAVAKKIKGNLTTKELELLIDELRQDHAKVIKELTPQATTQREHFKNDVLHFVQGLVKEFGAYSIGEEEILRDYPKDMIAFAKRLSTFTITEIIDILIEFEALQINGEDVGSNITWELVGHIDSFISTSDYAAIENDPTIGHLVP